MAKEKLDKLAKAKQKVEAIKGFYNHVVVYVVINIFLFFFKDKFVLTILNKNAIGDPDFLNWIDWNFYGTPIIWGLVLAIHGIVVFGTFSRFFTKWEDRQIKKIMQENNSTFKE